MESQTSEFRDLIDQLQRGNEDAAWQLVEIYGPYILRVVRRRLDADIRSKFDSMDFVQAVWKSFFTDRSKADELESPGQLIGLLAAIARHKIIDQHRKRRTQKYNVGRETSLHDSTTQWQADLTDQTPTPSQVVIAREQWQLLMNELSERDRRIVELRLSGETYLSIGEQVDLTERQVRRILEKLLRERLT